MLDLTNDELSALVEACNLASVGSPRPPWDRAGRSAWAKLLLEERRRGSLSCRHGIRKGDDCKFCNRK